MSVQAENKEELLIQAIKNGDQAAFESLYDLYAAMAYGLILRIIPDEELARDLLQDVFLRVWQSAASYDKLKGRLSTWILNIARNRAIDETRSRNYRKTQANQDLSKSVYDSGSFAVQPKTDSIGLKKYANMLRTEQRELIDLIYFRGYTHEEAARELNIPLGTVKTRIRAGIQALKKVLKIES